MPKENLYHRLLQVTKVYQLTCADHVSSLARAIAGLEAARSCHCTTDGAVSSRTKKEKKAQCHIELAKHCAIG